MRFVARACLLLVCLSCRDSGVRNVEPALLQLMPPARTGVSFSNELPDDTAFNALEYLYYYNGGGVAVGDVDNDGLPDLYFTSSRGANRLYRNLGNYRFEDVTERAGVADSTGWKTGVTMADVNGDGYIDIYVSGVDHLSMHGRNVLYINNGNGTFTDRTREFGLDYVGYSTQALFFDYDNDGDLDMFLLNHATHRDRKVGGSGRAALKERSASLGDRLYRNDGDHFRDVSAQAGIYGGIDFGLGVVASDLNGDGCVDLYVANDFQEDDLLYYNNCDGTFSEDLGASMRHTSQFSMGVDAADLDNDLRPDIVTVDMLPDREAILKGSASTESTELFNLKIAAGYHAQYSRNILQLNRGDSPTDVGGARAQRRGRLPLFSDVGYLAGVFATDWSWAPLLADLDNDGRKDLFITDGVYRRPNDRDFISYISNPVVQSQLAGAGARGLASLRAIERMPHVPMSNHVFRNQGGLRFDDVTRRWGMTEPGFSNGAAYVDLNNDGALDLVINRINAPAAVYRNRVRELRPDSAHWLQVRLEGLRRNRQGIGARVFVTAGGTRQVLEQLPTRGFQSSVDPRLHFGLGAATRVDSLSVVWPDGRSQVLYGLRGDTVLTLHQGEAQGRWDRLRPDSRRSGWFRDVTDISRLDFRHRENDFLDYNREPLIPHLLSAEGPALAVGDVNGDSLEDVYVGGAKWQPGRLFLQRKDGTFEQGDSRGFLPDSLAEDVDAVFLDADGDGDLDLYVVSGGNEFWESDDALQDRLYINDGAGSFHRSVDAIPRLAESGSHVAVGDFDGDGDPDLFIGRRAVSRRYGESPASYLLQNDGRGHFTDVTAQRAPELARAGMVTSAAWLDYDRDGRLDLVVVGEWMPVRVFHQEGGRLVDRTNTAGMGGTTGWWNTVRTADLNGDGRQDLILGNLGLNSYIRASRNEPVRLYLGDFAHDGSLLQILTFYKGGVSYPLAGRDEIVRAIPSLRGRFPTYASFGASRVGDILPAADLQKARVLEATTFASMVALSRADGTFGLQELPELAQLAPVFGAVADDFNGDGRVDLLIGGNFFGVPPVLGRYDASYGLVLAGAGDGHFVPVDMDVSGVAIEGQVRHMERVRMAGGGRLIAVARNNDKVQVLRTTH